MPTTEANDATMSIKIRAEEELSSCLCCVTKTSTPRISSRAVEVYNVRLFWGGDVGWCQSLVQTSSNTKPNQKSVVMVPVTFPEQCVGIERMDPLGE
jgi:hypothetical protein